MVMVMAKMRLALSVYVVQALSSLRCSAQSVSVEYWLTTSDQASLLAKQPSLSFTTDAINNNNPTIEVETGQLFQNVEGFGYCLTGGSAMVMNQLDADDRTSLLNELFGNDDTSIGISFLRLSIGSSDLNDHVFSYDDIPDDVETDFDLLYFSLEEDETDLIPLLQDILKINPELPIIATPWSAPVWMKSIKSTVGGSLNNQSSYQYYQTYANYFVKYVQSMGYLGVNITAITPQNEPLNPNNNPSMTMSAAEQSLFIQQYLGPAFMKAGLTTRIISYDHNCDDPEYPMQVLEDDAENNYVYGSAFHLYAGDISALSTVHDAFPDRSLYLTEQWTSATGNFGDDLLWAMQNVVIGTMLNWGSVAMEWNLASTPLYTPHTPGGCTECKGALTINTASSPALIERNVAYYIIGHASKFIKPRSVRIGSNSVDTSSCNLLTAAFLQPDEESIALLVENLNSDECEFNIRVDQNRWVNATLPGSSVATFTS
jgi:glucosylceramidase